MVTNIHAMVKMILTNQQKRQQQEQQKHHKLFTEVVPTLSPFHILDPPENFSPRYTEGETVKTTGLVRWPKEAEDTGVRVMDGV